MKRGPAPTKRRAEMVRLYQQGWTQRAIADRYGVCVKSVWMMLQRAKNA